MKNLLHIGAGIFIFLVAASISNLVEITIHYLLLLLKVNHNLNFWIINFIGISIFLISIILLIKWFEKRIKLGFDKKILIPLLILYFFIQILQFVFNYYIIEILKENYIDNYDIRYLETISSSMFHIIVNTVFIYATHILIFIYIYAKINKNTDL